jgi:hypothetical protein
VLFSPLVVNAAWRYLPGDVVVWNALAATALLASAFMKPVSWDSRLTRWLAAFVVCFLVVGLINFGREGRGLMVFIGRHSGAFMALALAAYISGLNESQRRGVLERIVPAMAIVFVFQLAYSMFESLAGEEYIIQSFDWNSSGSSYEFDAPLLDDRLQIGLISSHLTIPFKMTFTGMLGQHNHWGTQLPFFNLTFMWYLFHRRERPWWLSVLPVLTFLAAVLNTSRFGIISILVTDIVFVLLHAKLRRGIKGMLIGIPIVLLLVNAREVIELGTTYVDMTNTFEGRLDTWGSAWPQVLTRGVFDFVMGSTASTIAGIQRQFEWADFENLALSMLMEKGAVTFVVFLVMTAMTWMAGAGNDPVSRTTFRLLVVCMVLVSIWSNVLLRSTSFGVVAVLMCCLARPESRVAAGSGGRNHGDVTRLGPGQSDASV